MKGLTCALKVSNGGVLLHAPLIAHAVIFAGTLTGQRDMHLRYDLCHACLQTTPDTAAYLTGLPAIRNAVTKYVVIAQKEILAYFEGIAKKYDLYRCTRLHTEVTGAAWDGAAKLWRIAVRDVRTGVAASVSARFVISAAGALHRPDIPLLPGAETFKGPSFHSAQWRQDVDLTGKRVAVIGSAASAVQIVPAVIDRVAHLDLYQRTASWVVPRYDFAYPLWAVRLVLTFLCVEVIRTSQCRRYCFVGSLLSHCCIAGTRTGCLKRICWCSGRPTRPAPWQRANASACSRNRRTREAHLVDF